MATVVTSKPYQFHYEIRTWIRLLEFFKLENTFLKNRLAEVVDETIDKGFLAMAEQFQNKFIIKDEYIDELRHDINLQDQDLTKQLHESELGNKIIKRQDKLRNEMEFFENDFNKLKNDFNKCLSAVI